MIKIKNVQSLKTALEDCAKTINPKDETENIIIVPDKLALFMEQFLFERLNISASFSIKVMTFNRILKRGLEIDKEKELSNIGSILLINRILNEHRDEFESFNSKTYSFNYSKEIYNTIMQMKSSNIVPADLFKHYDDTSLNSKIQDLRKVYEYYIEAKANKLDSSDEMLLANMTIVKDVMDKNITFVGFDDFTAIEYSVIENLAKSNVVTIYNYRSKLPNRFIYNSQVVDKMKTISRVDMLNIIYEDVDSLDNGLNKYLADNLFLPKTKYEISGDEFRAFSGGNITDELEFVARDIRLKILNNSKYRDFGVAVYSPADHIDEIERIFRKYEINYYLDTQIPINHGVFYKFLLSLLKYFTESYNGEHLIDLINSPFVELGANEKLVFISALKKCGFKGKLTKDFEFKECDDVRNKIVDFISKFDADSAKGFITSIENEYDSFVKVIDGVTSNDVKNTVIHKKSVDNTIDLLVDIVGNGIHDLPELLDVFIKASPLIMINNLPITLDAVKIVDADNTFEVFDNLYIVSCDINHAPKQKADCGIILDTDIARLDIGKMLSPTINHINNLNRLRLYNLLLGFNNSLTITYSSQPSLYIKDIVKNIVLKTANGKRSCEIFNSKSRFALTDWDYIEKLSQYEKDNKNINFIKNLNFSNLNSKSIDIFGDLDKISASWLETYFRCPFKHLMEKTLKIEEQNNETVKALDVGNILHGIAYKYYVKKKQVGDINEFCLKAIDEYIKREDVIINKQNSQIFNALVEEAVRMIQGLNYIDENSVFEPIKFEHRFVDGLGLGDKKLSLYGSIDRVDKCNDMLRIVDYKSGNANPSVAELFYGKKLQLFLYSIVAEKELANKVVGCFYLPLHNAYEKQEGNTYSLDGFYLNEDFIVSALDKRLEPKQKSDIVNAIMTLDGKARRYGKELDSNEFNVLKNYAVDVSSNATNEILSGYIEPKPIDADSTCKYCPYSHICFRQTSSRRVRKSKPKSIEEIMGGQNG